MRRTMLTKSDIDYLLRLVRYRLRLEQAHYVRDEPKRQAKGIEPFGPRRDIARVKIDEQAAVVGKLEALKKGE